jgi:hypothetical protein
MGRLPVGGHSAAFALVVGALALSLDSSAASADEPLRASLVYSDESQGACPSEAVLRERVHTRLGFDPFVDRAPLAFRARISAHGKRFVAELDVIDHGGPAGKRSLDDASCTTLVETLASTIALTIDPIGTGGSDSHSAGGDSPPPLPPPVSSTSSASGSDRSGSSLGEDPSVRREREKKRTGLSLLPSGTLDGVAHFGLVPSPTFGARLGLGFVIKSFAIHVEGSTETTASAGGGTNELVAAIHAAHVVPCGAFASVLLACGDLTLGVVSARARFGTDPSAVDPLVGLGARFGLRLPLTGVLSLRAMLEGGITPVRVGYLLDGARAATTGPVYGGATLGLELRAP